MHNEYDRMIRARRDPTGPLVDRRSLYNRVFGTTLFVRPDPAAETSVVDPTGRRLEHTTGSEPLHYRYGASTGTYTIALTGRNDSEYAGSQHRAILNETIEGSIAVGEAERYVVLIDDGSAALVTGLGGTAVFRAIGVGYASLRGQARRCDLPGTNGP